MSLLLPAIIFFLVEGNELRTGGLTAMKTKLGKNSIFLICAYVLLFAWAVIHTTYRDHMDLAAAVGIEHSELVDSSNQLSGCEGNLGSATGIIRDKQSLVDTLQKTMISMQGPEAQQQANIASCISNLAKMNPIIMRKITVIAVPLATTDMVGHLNPKTPLSKRYITELFVITNFATTDFHGILTCGSPFRILSGPAIDSEDTLMYVGGQGPKSLSDRSYEIRYRQLNAEWNTTHPAYLQIQTNDPTPNGCSFTPTE